MNVVDIDITKIKNYNRNAKIHTQSQIDALAKAITEFGFRVPLLVKSIDGGKDYEIIAGHGRVSAARSIGMETVPCHVVDDLTDDQIKALRIADNKLNESEWDKPLLLAEFGELEEYLQDLTGVDINDLGVDTASDIDFDNIESNENREKEFKDHLVTCPECQNSFNIKI